MKRKYKNTHKLYSAWNYENEIEDLNKYSEEGWQLAHGGAFSSRLVKNDGVRYKYQLDFCPKIDDMGRYIETFREQGWEYVNSTFNGWHYFRKLYDPSLPESDYKIFTDRASLKEMNGRWAKIATAITALLGICVIAEAYFAFTEPKIPGIILLLALLLEFIIFLRGIIIMKKTEKSKNDRSDVGRTTAFFIVLFLGLASFVILSSLRPSGDTQMSAAEYNPVSAKLSESTKLNSFEVKYGDNYYLDIEQNASAPATFTITNEAGETVYETRGDSYNVDDAKLRLTKGQYAIWFSDFAGGSVKIKYSID